jgi:hypothetical protein
MSWLQASPLSSLSVVMGDVFHRPRRHPFPTYVDALCHEPRPRLRISERPNCLRSSKPAAGQERNFWMQRPEAKNPPERPLLSAETGNVENRRQDPRRSGLFSIDHGFRSSGRLDGGVRSHMRTRLPVIWPISGSFSKKTANRRAKVSKGLQHRYFSNIAPIRYQGGTGSAQLLQHRASI